MNDEKQEMKEAFNFVTGDMDNKSKDISRFIWQANEQEFTICRFFIGWSIASIGAITVFYLQNSSTKPLLLPYLIPLIVSLVFLSLSVAFGVSHHFSFHNQLINKAQELDNDRKNILKNIIEKNMKGIIAIRDNSLETYANKSTIEIGKRWLLYLQFMAFLIGILSFVLCVIFCGYLGV